MTEPEFQKRADQALEQLSRVLMPVGDEHGFEVDFNGGVLTLEFDEPKARFVVSPNTPPRQIWVSALTRSFKLDWHDGKGVFFHKENEQSLEQLLFWAVRKHLGHE